VGMTGVTTVNARLASPSAVSSAIARSAAPSAAPTAAAADDNDSDDGLELVGEQTLDEVLAVRAQIACNAMPAQNTMLLGNFDLGSSVPRFWCAKCMLVKGLARRAELTPSGLLTLWKCVCGQRNASLFIVALPAGLHKGTNSDAVNGDTVAWSKIISSAAEMVQMVMPHSTV